jgi:ribosomal protein S18 acetylase RimI-like enzyme
VLIVGGVGHGDEQLLVVEHVTIVQGLPVDDPGWPVPGLWRLLRKDLTMALTCVPVSETQAEKLVPILHDAEEDDERIRAAVRDPACRSYAALVDGRPVGAAVVRWEEQNASEILYVAVAAGERGKGYGKHLVAAIQAELPAHGRTLLVGTANSALDNIAFYQKCGFRMCAVRRDHFNYIRPSLVEHGIVMRDMIVFAYEAPGPLVSNPLFCDVALAGRIELVEVQRLTEGSAAAHRRRPDTTGFVLAVAGGVASFAEPGSPLNKVAGLGFDGVPDAADLDRIERAFAARGAPVQVELAHLADPAIGALLTARGYRLVSFENVLGRTLGAAPEQVKPPGVEIRPSGDDEFERWLDVVSDAAVHPDTQGVPDHEEFSRETIVKAMRDLTGAAGVRRYLALCDGVPVGGASMCLAEGVAQLTGAATTPAHRRRGVQTALLSARLADAATAGGDIAVVTTRPGSRSQHNVQRQGFDLLYTRAVLRLGCAIG